jgi:hypothetical protein
MKNTMKPRHYLCLAGAWMMLAASFPARAAPSAEDFVERPWQENEVALPPFPEDDALYGFYVSPTTTNRFFVDLQTLSIGSDGVLRYTLVVLSASGVRNVTFEGMRCKTREWRIYASGRSDGSWSCKRGFAACAVGERLPSREERWLPIRETGSNRQHAALFLEFFCPGGVIGNAEEIRNAFKKEGKPFAKDGF